MKEWDEGISKWRADKVKSAFKKKHGRSLGSSRKSSHISRRHIMSARHSRSKKQRLHRVSPRMQREWAEGISQLVIQREVTRSNHCFLKKFGIIKGNSSEEWEEGIQVWLDQGLLNKSWKWRASKGKFKPSKNRRRIKRLKSVISGENRFRLKSHTPNKRKQTSTASSESESNSEKLEIYVFKNERQFGPYPLDEIEKFLVNSQLNLDDLAFHKGCENWIKVSELPNLKFKQEPKKPEKLIPKKEHQVVQKPTLRKPDEKSQRNRSEKVNVSHESNHSQIQIEPRKTKRKFLILGSASLTLMGLVAAVFYYLNIGDNQNTKIANEDPAESTFERLMQKKFDFKEVKQKEAPVTDLTSGLVAWYPFDGDARDMSGNGNDGTVYGATPREDRNGGAGKAYQFDGVDDKIQIASKSLNNRSEFSVGFWAFLSQNKSHHIISAANKKQDNEFIIAFKPYIEIFKKGIFLKPLNSFATTNLYNEWNQYAIISNSKEKKMSMYLNGTLRTLIESDANALEISPNGLWLGAEQDIVGGGWRPNEHFKGSMDDLRIYDRAFSAAEVQALYNLGQ